MSIYNKTFPNWIKGDNNITQGSAYSDNVSLRNDGKTELRGDTYITNNGRLMINKDKNSTTNYKLDVEDVNNILEKHVHNEQLRLDNNEARRLTKIKK